MKHCCRLLLVIGWVAVPGFASPAHSALPAPHVERSFQLGNGLRVALAPDPAATTVDVSLWFPAGSRYERAGQSGLTHMFDGLLFAGTPKHPVGEHQRLIQRAGGVATAFSSPDFACAEDNVPPAALGLALELEADRMEHLALDARSFEAARIALGQEHRTSAERSPLGRSLRQLYGVAFAGHPYRWPIQGMESDLAHMTLPLVQAWWRGHYGPSGTLLTIAGQIDADSAEAAVRRAFGSLPARRAVARAEPAPPPRQIVERRVSGKVEAQVPLLLLGWRTAAQASADGIALEMLDRVLSQGSKSRIQGALVSDSSACLDVETGLDLRRDGGIYYVVAAVRPGMDSTEAEREILEGFDRVIRDPVSRADLDGAIRKTQLDALLGWQSSAGAGRSLGMSACIEGDFNADTRRLDATQALTPEALQDVVERTFTESHRSVLWLNPAPAAPPGKPAAKPGTRRAPPRTPATKKGGR